MIAVHHRRYPPYDGADAEDDAEDDAANETDGEVNGHESATEDLEAAAAATGGTDVDDEEIDDEDGVAANADAAIEDVLDLEVDGAPKDKLHDPSRQKFHASTEERLHSYWNVHDAHHFTQDYDDEIANLEHTWDHAYRQSKIGKKQDVHVRPNPYLESKVAKGEFLQITPIEEYLESLKTPETMSYDELYAATANAAHALQTWQDEWQAIDALSKLATRHAMKKTADPRRPIQPTIFEDQKEAMLYGYKYDAKEAMVGVQDPFIQGGFRPTPAQLRKMRAAPGVDPQNPDGWKTITKFGVEHAPRFQNPPMQSFEGKQTRKRRVAQTEVATLPKLASETNDSATPAFESDLEGRPAKRLTRSRAGKPLAGRETPQARTAPPSPGRRGGRGRGRGGRGRGGIFRSSQASHNTPARSSARVAIARAAVDPAEIATAATAVRAVSSSTPPPPMAPTSMPSAVAPIAPAPVIPTLAPAASAAMPAMASVPSLVTPGESVDAAELARRQKIANSKNPRRTEAMLNHWARFNKEGRIRNPKRTKAQIEADKAAEADQGDREPSKEPGSRKRKAAGTITTTTTTTTTTTSDGPAAKQARVDTTTPGPASLHPAPIQPASGPGSSMHAHPPPHPPPPLPAGPPQGYPRGPAYPPPVLPLLPPAMGMPMPGYYPPRPPPPPFTHPYQEQPYYTYGGPPLPPRHHERR
jgi:hypothetical protein